MARVAAWSCANQDAKRAEKSLFRQRAIAQRIELTTYESASRYASVAFEKRTIVRAQPVPVPIDECRRLRRGAREIAPEHANVFHGLPGDWRYAVQWHERARARPDGIGSVLAVE